MSKDLEIPPECSLKQAALWLWKGIQPIHDRIYEGAPLDIDFSHFDGRELLLRLRAGSIRSWGKPFLKWWPDDEYAAPQVIKPLSDPEEDPDQYPFDFVRIPQHAWILDCTEWADSTISIPFLDLGLPGYRQMITDLLPSRRCYTPVLEFEDITVLTEDLFACFPGASTESQDIPGQRPAVPANTTIAAEKKCKRWLTELMQAGDKQKTKGEYEDEAVEKFSVSRNSFRSAWRQAAENTKSNWTRPGRNPKK